MVYLLVLAVFLPLVNAQLYVYQPQWQQYHLQQQQYYAQQAFQMQYYQQANQQSQKLYAVQNPQQPQFGGQQYQQPQVQFLAPASNYQGSIQVPTPVYQKPIQTPTPIYQKVSTPSKNVYTPKISESDQVYNIASPSVHFIETFETKVLTPPPRVLINRPAQPGSIPTPSPAISFQRSIPQGQTASTMPRVSLQQPLLTPKPIPTMVVTPKPQKPAAPAISHFSGSKDPNSYFLSCCKIKKVDKKCESRCNFDNLSKKVLTGMFLGSDPCPQSDGLDLFSCAAQDSDHTPCCRRKNVMRTGAGNKCLDFCRMTPDAQFQADASYLPCWTVLNDIKACFKESIIDDIAKQG